MFKGTIGDCLQKYFCYAGWKSLHIPIAIIKLSGLNVFICVYIFCGRHRTKKCSSNQNVRYENYERLAYLPVNICVCIPLYTLFAQTGFFISVFTYAMQTEWEWQANINNLIFLPGIAYDTWCIVVMLSLVVWSVCIHVFRRRGFGRRFAGRVGRTLSVL